MVEQILDKLVHIPTAFFSHWGYFLTFFAALLETLPLVGILITGQTFVILGGFMSRLGVVDLPYIMFFGAMGAILGDFTSYYLGRRFGHPFLLKYGKYFFFKEEYYEKARTLLRENKVKALLIGRFSSMTRAFVPFIAGASEIRMREFIPLNVIGGITWAIFYVLVGYVFGASYEIASQYIGRILLGALVLWVLFIYGYRLINKRKHVFERYHIYTLFLGLLALAGFARLADAVLDRESWLFVINEWVYNAVAVMREPISNDIFNIVSFISRPWILILLILAILTIYLVRSKFYHFALLIFSAMSGLMLELTFKLSFHQPRPINQLADVSGYSFPSGHATLGMILFGILIYSFKNEIKNIILKYLFIGLNVFFIFIIGFSRIYFNLHWFGDVFGGFFLGLFTIIFWILILKLIIAAVEISLQNFRSAVYHSISKIKDKKKIYMDRYTPPLKRYQQRKQKKLERAMGIIKKKKDSPR